MYDKGLSAMKKIFLAILMISTPVSADESILNLTQYFEYLPTAIHKNWIPFQANSDYEVLVQFRVNKNGDISKPFIVISTNEKANASVIKAVESSAPLKPLPAKFTADSVNTQVELKYIHNTNTSY